MEVTKFNYTRKEAAFSLGVCVRTVDYLIARGDLQTTRIGKKVLVPREILRRYASGNHPEAVDDGWREGDIPRKVSRTTTPRASKKRQHNHSETVQG